MRLPIPPLSDICFFHWPGISADLGKHLIKTYEKNAKEHINLPIFFELLYGLWTGFTSSGIN